MTKEDALRWHAALASIAGQLSGALARGSWSPRLLNTSLAMLKPVVREMEIADYKTQAKAEVEKEAKPQRQKRKRR